MMVLLRLLILDLLSYLDKRINKLRPYLDHHLIWHLKFLIIDLIIIRLIFGVLELLSIKWFLASNFSIIQSTIYGWQYHWLTQKDQEGSINFSESIASINWGRIEENVSSESVKTYWMERSFQTPNKPNIIIAYIVKFTAKHAL